VINSVPHSERANTLIVCNELSRWSDSTSHSLSKAYHLCLRCTWRMLKFDKLVQSAGPASARQSRPEPLELRDGSDTSRRLCAPGHVVSPTYQNPPPPPLFYTPLPSPHLHTPFATHPHTSHVFPPHTTLVLLLHSYSQHDLSCRAQTRAQRNLSSALYRALARPRALWIDMTHASST
jgi:hypothetical protein